MPLIGAATGLIAGALSAYLYNAIAERIGGIRINLK